MSGFSSTEESRLKAIFKEVMDQFTYQTDLEQWHVEEYWEDDAILRHAIKGHAKFKSDCEGFAMVCLHKVNDADFNARLVLCTDEFKEGHCICEVSSKDGQEAYYFDNRRVGPATRQSLIDYVFYAVSPWNPQPGETRPWEAVVAS